MRSRGMARIWPWMTFKIGREGREGGREGMMMLGLADSEDGESVHSSIPCF